MKKKILIVDDNPVILKALSLKLTANGYEVLKAIDGSEAVKLVREKRPDLIIVDINFPPDVGHGGGVPWDAFLILEWLRRFEETKGIPALIITGSELEKYKDRAVAAGAVGLLRKPVNNEELLNLVQQTLGKND